MTLAEAVALATFFTVLTVWHMAGGVVALAAIVAIFVAYQIGQGGRP